MQSRSAFCAALQPVFPPAHAGCFACHLDAAQWLIYMVLCRAQSGRRTQEEKDARAAEKERQKEATAARKWVICSFTLRSMH